MVVPKWARLLTGGVDVQENCLYWSIRAWGNYLTSQNIAHGQALGFREVERVMNLQYEREDDHEPMVVALALIDSGNDTDRVYDFCADNSEWALPCKGSSGSMDSHFRISRVNKTDSKAYGMNLVLVDGNKYKDMIAGRMRRDNGTGSWMVHAECDREYAEQVTAEHKVNVRSGSGKVTQRWVPKTSHADNHYLDTEVYAMAAADCLGVRTLHMEMEQEQNQEEKPKQENPPPEDNWLDRKAAADGGRNSDHQSAGERPELQDRFPEPDPCGFENAEIHAG